MLTRRIVMSLALVLAGGWTGTAAAQPRAPLETGSRPAGLPTSCGPTHYGLEGLDPAQRSALGGFLGAHDGGCVYAVSADSPTDIWAVGSYSTEYGDQALVIHWDGGRWTPSDNPTPAGSVLYGVSAVSPGDAWAVGYQDDGSIRTPLVEHWNGAAWTVVSSPSPGQYGADLISVSADSATDAWAVGSIFDAQQHRPLVNLAHWDGSSWSQVVLPDPHCGWLNINVNVVKAVSPTNVWLLGDCPHTDRPFLDHWDGSQWRVHPGPALRVNITGATLNGVAALGSADMWAVGWQQGTVGDQLFTHPLIEHYDGLHWNRVPSPLPGGSDSTTLLRSVSMSGPEDIWAVGTNVVGSPGSLHDELLVQHWNGTQWATADMAAPKGHGVTDADLWGVVGTHSGAAWAVGNVAAGLSSHALVERWNGSRWQVQSVTTPLVASTRLVDVVATATDDVWAVGSSGLERPRAVVEHWDGSRWRTMSLPRTGDTSAFESVSATSADDVWAAGWRANASHGYFALVEHWDGQRWSEIEAPEINGGFMPTAVTLSADAVDDAWCVGYQNKGAAKSLIWHWAGDGWAGVAPPPGNPNRHRPDFQTVRAISPSDVWVAGSVLALRPDRTGEYAAHWDGSAWTVATSGPFHARGRIGVIHDIDARSGSDVTAVGMARVGDDPFLPVAAHWDGTSWTQSDIPGLGSSTPAMSVSASAADDIWVAGGDKYQGSAFVDRWDGSTWTMSPGLEDAHTLVSEGGVAALSPTDVWVVGAFEGDNGSTRAAVVHWDGQRWTWF